MTAFSTRPLANEITRATAAEVRLRGNTYNVLDYGADPTGASNDTAAFLAAVAAAGVNGTVYVPGRAGGASYNVTSQLAFGIHAGIVGDGVDAVTINTSTGANPAMLWLGSGAPEALFARFIRLSGFSLRHTGTQAAIRLELCVHSLISDLFVQGVSTSAATGNGVEVYDCYGCTFTNVRSLTFGKSGFQVFSSGVTQPGQHRFITCDAGFTGLYGWDYNSAGSIIDGCSHVGCVVLGAAATTRGWSFVGGGGLRCISITDCHIQNESTSNTMAGIYQSGADSVCLKLDGLFFTKVKSPIRLTGTVHGCEIGRLNLVVSGVTSPANYVIETNSGVEGLSLGWVRNASTGAYAHVYDGLAASVQNPWAWA